MEISHSDSRFAQTDVKDIYMIGRGRAGWRRWGGGVITSSVSEDHGKAKW